MFACRSLAMLTITALAATAVAADWSVRTTIDDGRGRAASEKDETMTYFAGGSVYDFSNDPPQMAILDPAAGKMILIDEARRWRTEITTQELQDLTERLRTLALRHDDPLMRFAAEPKFETSFERRSGEARFVGPRLSYRVAFAAPSIKEAASEYRTMADCFARLGAIHPGRLPAAARLAVNEEVSRRGLIPEKVELTIHDAASGKTIVRRSRHKASWKLSAEDHRRIEHAKRLAEACEQVNFARFHGLK